jgi:hypothetical protein
VGEEASAPCPTGLMVLLGTVCEPLIIHLMEGPFLGLSSGQAAVASHGVEVEVGSLVAGEGSVVGNKRVVAWGLRRNLTPYPL